MALDQIRAVDKSRLINKVGVIKEPTRSKVLAILQEIPHPVIPTPSDRTHRGGTTHIVMSPLEFMQRLAALS